MGEAIVGTFPSITGAGLESRMWLPQGEPRAVVQLVHGMAEHIARYDAMARQLNDQGFLVVGHTHLGHGAAAGTLGWFADHKGWDALVSDVHVLRLSTQASYPDVPYFLLGHSMGSFIVRTYAQRYEEGLAGIILSGTGHFEPLILNAGLLIANLQCLLGGAKKPSKLLESISFAGYNSGFDSVRTAFDWLSKDQATVDAYMADPYCGFPFTAGGYRDMFRGLKNLYPKNLAGMVREVPVYLFSGASDPVGNRGQGVKITAGELRDAGVTDVTVKLYEGGRHEMLNEVERRQVLADLIAWLDSHVQA